MSCQMLITQSCAVSNGSLITVHHAMQVPSMGRLPFIVIHDLIGFISTVTIRIYIALSDKGKAMLMVYSPGLSGSCQQVLRDKEMAGLARCPWGEHSTVQAWRPLRRCSTTWHSTGLKFSCTVGHTLFEVQWSSNQDSYSPYLWNPSVERDCAQLTNFRAVQGVFWPILWSPLIPFPKNLGPHLHPSTVNLFLLESKGCSSSREIFTGYQHANLQLLPALYAFQTASWN